MGATKGASLRGEDLIGLMKRELGIHPDNGRRLLAAGYVSVGGQTVGASDELPWDEARGKTLEVVKRKLRLVAPTRAIVPQGELF